MQSLYNHIKKKRFINNLQGGPCSTMSRVPLLVELTEYVQTPSSLPQNLCNLIDTNVCYIINTIWVDFDCEKSLSSPRPPLLPLVCCN